MFQIFKINFLYILNNSPSLSIPLYSCCLFISVAICITWLTLKQKYSIILLATIHSFAINGILSPIYHCYISGNVWLIFVF